MAVEFDEEPRVLVISEDVVLRRSLARMLALRGFRTLEAADEVEAADGCRRGPSPCLILADFSRSAHDDRTGARRIRGRAELRDIPLLIVSAEVDRPPGAEAEGFIAEVFDFEQLLFLLGRLTPPARDGDGRP